MDGEGTGGQEAGGPGDRCAQRTGTADRTAAVDALGSHLRAGRLTTQEYEQRSEDAKRAVTWGDIDSLFSDLPAPHPAPGTTVTDQIAPLGSVAGVPPSVPGVTPVPVGRAPSVPATSGHGSHDVEAGGGLVSPEVGRWLMALAAPVALILFFVFDFSWWVWLLIPVVSMIVFGPHGGNHKRRS